eukprot:TRINITY_DN1979_c1_g2_i1.p1 TRINITY_DN1979_c1_g2~~TRINITY_DN1979_c1_g2_i1.p1  ORF type:complete len:439 (-),score=207.41 TRINITY_DN1979_c1_g2_i1:13-1329(-)
MATELEVKNASLILEENRELFEALTRKFRLTKEEVETTKEKVKGFLDVDLLPHLHSVTMGLLTVGSIKGFCRPPISHFSATAISEGEKGEWSFGVNLEFEGHPLNASVHAEQFSISNLYMGGEHKLIRISTSPAPCGHCRQFMNECNGREDLIVQMNRMEGSSLFLTLSSLPQLLPYNFSPKDLGCKILLLQTRAESGEPELPVTLISSSSTSSTSTPLTDASSNDSLSTSTSSSSSSSSLPVESTTSPSHNSLSLSLSEPPSDSPLLNDPNDLSQEFFVSNNDLKFAEIVTDASLIEAAVEAIMKMISVQPGDEVTIKGAVDPKMSKVKSITVPLSDPLQKKVTMENIQVSFKASNLVLHSKTVSGTDNQTVHLKNGHRYKKVFWSKDRKQLLGVFFDDDNKTLRAETIDESNIVSSKRPNTQDPSSDAHSKMRRLV